MLVVLGVATSTAQETSKNRKLLQLKLRQK
jgi:hypothetical protein